MLSRDDVSRAYRWFETVASHVVSLLKMNIIPVVERYGLEQCKCDVARLTLELASRRYLRENPSDSNENLAWPNGANGPASQVRQMLNKWWEDEGWRSSLQAVSKSVVSLYFISIVLS